MYKILGQRSLGNKTGSSSKVGMSLKSEKVCVGRMCGRVPEHEIRDVKGA